MDVIGKGYIQGPGTSTGTVKSYMSFFHVPKPSPTKPDVRLVYNGSSCGLNDCFWAPNFWMPNAQSEINVLLFNYVGMDIDFGEMFLNFPLPWLAQKYS